MLSTNEDVELESRRLVDVTKDQAVVGQPRERILVFHPACIHTRVYANSVAGVSFFFSFFFFILFSPSRRSQIRSEPFVSLIYVTRRGSVGRGDGVGRG